MFSEKLLDSHSLALNNLNISTLDKSLHIYIISILQIIQNAKANNQDFKAVIFNAAKYQEISL